jgi:hypothetical protein
VRVNFFSCAEHSSPSDLINEVLLWESADLGVSRNIKHCSPATARLVATDLNGPMLEFARKKFRADERVQWQQADAMNPPLADGEFDAVVCQFGLMFVPDKLQALRAARPADGRSVALQRMGRDRAQRFRVARAHHNSEPLPAAPLG